MNLVHKIETWGNAHHPVVIDPIRIALGAFLLFKGISFMNNTYTIHSILVNQNSIGLSDSTLMFFVYLVAFVHLTGGIMIAFGRANTYCSTRSDPNYGCSRYYVEHCTVTY